MYFFRRALLNRTKKAHRIENTTVVMLILFRSRVPLKIESGKRKIRKMWKIWKIYMKKYKNIKKYKILYGILYFLYYFILFYIILYLFYIYFIFILYYFILFYIYFIFFCIILYFFRGTFLSRFKKVHIIDSATRVLLILPRCRVPLNIESGKL